MKKLLTVLLTLMLAVSLSVAVLSVSAKDTRDHGSKGSSYEAGNAMAVYQSFVDNNGETGGAVKKVENLFGAGAYANSWIINNRALTINADATAVMYPSAQTGHVLKNNTYGAGTFVMSFNIELNEQEEADKDNLYNTAAGKGNISQFWGIEFLHSADIGSSWDNLSVPWAAYGGYPYVICFDGETGPVEEANVVGRDGKATLPDGRLVADARAEDPDGEYGRLYQTGLTVRRYRYSGSHDYYRWSSSNPVDAIYVNDLGSDCPSLIPDYYREVRLEDIWDGNDHTLVVQFKPLSEDNGDGIDAIFIDIWMSGLDAHEEDETQVINGKTMTHVMRIYDEMPYNDMDNDGVVVDKRTKDGGVILWTHDDYSYNTAADQWNSKISISEFYMLNGASYKDFDVNTFPELTGPSMLGGSLQYDGQEHSFSISGMDDPEIKVAFYNVYGEKISEGLENMPAYSDAGEYTVIAKFSKAGNKPLSVEANLTIEKTKTKISAKNQTIAVGADVSAAVQTIKGNDIEELADYVTYSPAKSFTEEGIYTVIVSVPDTTNYIGSSKKIKVTVGAGSGSSDEAEFTDAEKDAINWVSTNLNEADNSATYDGTEHCLYLTNLPEGATVSYVNNVQINAGEYTVTAIVAKEGYADLTVTTAMTIKKADVTIEAADQTFYYCNSNISPKAVASNGAEILCQSISSIGTYELVLTVNESANYNAATKTITVQIVLDVKD